MCVLENVISTNSNHTYTVDSKIYIPKWGCLMSARYIVHRSLLVRWNHVFKQTHLLSENFSQLVMNGHSPHVHFLFSKTPYPFPLASAYLFLISVQSRWLMNKVCQCLASSTGFLNIQYKWVQPLLIPPWLLSIPNIWVIKTYKEQGISMFC